MNDLKLFMILIGCTPRGRHVEQHDFFFGIATELKELLRDMKAFWPEAEGVMHIDAWREVTHVDSHKISVAGKNISKGSQEKLFFINLGGYLKDRFEEQHYTLLSVKPNKTEAIKSAKATDFFKHNYYLSAASHIDDKYGIDVDELHDIEDILPVHQKEKYSLMIEREQEGTQDELHLGYLKLSKLQ
jgi:hypothetical protein